jgi:catechol 2,3-dioxygenase-like lactoylglutathione lyase family enzyme
MSRRLLPLRLPVALAASLLGSSGLALAEPVPFSGLAGATYRAYDLAEMRAFYGKGAGFRELRGQKGAVRFAIGQGQFLEFLPGGVKGYVVRFESVTLTTADLGKLQDALRARQIEFTRGPGRSVDFRDPFGHLIHVVQMKPRKAVAGARPASGFSQHLHHVSLVAHHNDEEKAQRFFGETLGLAESSRLNDKGGRPRFIKYRLPGERGDELEIFFVWGPQTTEQAGSAFHINFAVDDIAQGYCAFFRSGVADLDAHFPKVNPERLWTVELRDPESTRIEIQVKGPATDEISTTSDPPCFGSAEAFTLFNGKNLDGWSGEPGYWRVEDGMIVGESKMYMHYNTFLWHDTALLKDFYLSVHIKQTPSRLRNSGIQFRSHKIDGTNHAIGYQADVGTGLWGRVFHEEGRGHLFRMDTGEKAVDWEGWNHYEILAVGHRIWTAVNGTISARIEDPRGEITGRLALQIHFDPQQVTRFRDFKLVRNPPVTLAGHDEAALAKMLIPVKEEAGLNLVNATKPR